MRHSGLAFMVFLLIPASLPAAFTPSVARAAGPRARDLGVPFDGTPGDLNAITDVAGVLVGHTTLISGDGKLQDLFAPESRRCCREDGIPNRIRFLRPGFRRTATER